MAGKLRTASANKHRRGSFGFAQDRLFDSAPSAGPRDKSVRRFAQGDDFVGGLKKNTPNRLTLVGLTSWAKFSVPTGLDFEMVLLARIRSAILLQKVLRECSECSEADTGSYNCGEDVTRLFRNEHSL